MDKILCPKCNTENPEKNVYCEVCGAPLREEAQKPPVMPTSAVPPPPPPLPPIMPAAPRVYGTPLSSLGGWMDSWSEVVEGEAEAADKVTEAFIEEIKTADVEGVGISSADLVSKGAAPRKYHIVHNGRGSNLAVRIAPYGKDLWVSWDLFTRRSPNWLTLGIWLGAIVFLLLVGGILSWVFYSFMTSLSVFFSLALSLVLVTGFGLMLAGKILKDDVWGLFINELDDFELDDASALSSLVDNSLVNALDAVLIEEPEKPKTKK